MKQFKIGPLQEKWLQGLENQVYPQLSGELGRKKEDNQWACCCLGWGKICILENEGINIEKYLEENDRITDNSRIATLPSYNKLGLYSELGNHKNYCELKDNSLSTYNDSGMTWPEIAKLVRSDPQGFFSKSV